MTKPASPLRDSAPPREPITPSATSHELAIPDEDAISGAALTEQYHLAVGGMRHVLRFGGLMMQLRDRLSTVVQVRTTVGTFSEKDGGSIKQWLADFAPEIKSSTAFRFLHVAEAVASEFQTPAKVSFIDLVTSATADLSEKLQIKQAELWEYVDGTSQRSWLDRFAPHALRGGARTSTKEPGDDEPPVETPSGWLPHLWARYRTLTPEQRTAWDCLYIPAFKVFAEFERSLADLPDLERDELDGWLLDMRTKLRAARNPSAR